MSERNQRPRGKTLREHLTESGEASGLTASRRTNSAAPAVPGTRERDNLLAEVTREAGDFEYERWDGMS